MICDFVFKKQVIFLNHLSPINLYISTFLKLNINIGGVYGTRTRDLIAASDTRSQLR